MKKTLIFLVMLMALPVRTVRATWRRATLRAVNVRIATTVELRLGKGGSFEFKPGSAVGHGSLLIAETGRGNGPARLVVGAGSVINEYCNLRAAGGDIIIGRQCMFAQFVTVIATNHGISAGVPIIEQDWDDSRKGVKIGDDVWIGANVVILPGTTIQEGAVIAAGAVVNGNVPSNEIWGGIPAKFLKKRACRNAS